ncbi:argininosuccinate lyase [Allonocardiopsis opalescens]|uniref:argininosuccinate lyase n=1 Tax=Allonocardiopsis opalescens TaxID=1144618 RepID=A0A2T0PYB5_9ACTN|nr:lyase family protein [Allonocardiopsis opalescens]PRX96523.1 argininosuccinate lyase [Allonocardiopsis opalescens]
MSGTGAAPHPPVTGRLAEVPRGIVHTEVLEPQFRFEAEHLLDHYVHLERVLLLEYRRMGLIDRAQAAGIAAALDGVDAGTLRADPEANLSDISLALERHVADRLTAPVPAWHVDRSRNDVQATAQLMYGRAELLRAAGLLAGLARAAQRTAAGLTETPMPGYTHLQAAQVISPGFYLAAVSEQALFALRRLLAGHDDANRCPMGAGAMAGQQLAWDRERIARLAGCDGPQRHALTAVAGRDWAAVLAGELSAFAVVLSRFTTDFMAWAGEAHGFLELPDSLAGVSAAMPQKKNYPVLERVRGRSAHVVALAHDLRIATRNTSYSNSVEVGKEASRYLSELFASFRFCVALLTEAIAEMRFRPARMRAACEAAFTGGMALANELTLAYGVPWRTAQTIAGAYIRAALESGGPDARDGALLAGCAARHGHRVSEPDGVLKRAFDVDLALRRFTSSGSAHPDEVRALLADQAAELEALEAEVAARVRRAADAAAEVRRLLGGPTGEDR